MIQKYYNKPEIIDLSSPARGNGVCWSGSNGTASACGTGGTPGECGDGNSAVMNCSPTGTGFPPANCNTGTGA